MAAPQSKTAVWCWSAAILDTVDVASSPPSSSSIMNTFKMRYHLMVDYSLIFWHKKTCPEAYLFCFHLFKRSWGGGGINGNCNIKMLYCNSRIDYLPTLLSLENGRPYFENILHTSCFAIIKITIKHLYCLCRILLQNIFLNSRS